MTYLPKCVKSIDLEIPGDPMAKARPRVRVIRKGGAYHGTAYDPKQNIKNEEWVGSVAIQKAPPVPYDWAVSISATYYFRIPTSRPKWWRALAKTGIIRPITKPDLDNLNKLLWDTLTRAGWWKDDAQVVSESSIKKYSDKPRTVIHVDFYQEPTHQDYKARL